MSGFDPISLVWTVININLAYVFIELSPFKTILRKFSYGILLTCSLLDIMLCSFTLWANLTEEVTPLSCRLTEKIRNISKISNLYPSVKSDIKGVLMVKPSVFLKTHLHRFWEIYVRGSGLNMEIIKSNIIFVTSFYFIYLFLWLRQMKFYQDPLLKDNYPQPWFKIQIFEDFKRIGCVGVITGLNWEPLKVVP